MAATLLFAIVPAAFAVTTHPIVRATGTTYSNTPSLYNEEAGPIPVQPALRLQARRAGNRIVLTWQRQPSVSAPFVYQVVRTPIATANRPFLDSESRTWITHATTFVDVIPPAERDDYFFRILEVASWTGNPAQGDGYVASNPAVVRLLPKGVSSPAGCGVVPDEDHDWETVVGAAGDRASAVTIGARVAEFIPTAVLRIEAAACNDYKVVSEFSSRAEAEAFAQQLATDGYSRTWHVQPYVVHS